MLMNCFDSLALGRIPGTDSKSFMKSSDTFFYWGWRKILFFHTENGIGSHSRLSTAAFLHPISMSVASISQGAQIRRLFSSNSHFPMTLCEHNPRPQSCYRSQAQTLPERKRKHRLRPIVTRATQKSQLFDSFHNPKKVAYFYRINEFCAKTNCLNRDHCMRVRVAKSWNNFASNTFSRTLCCRLRKAENWFKK